MVPVSGAYSISKEKSVFILTVSPTTPPDLYRAIVQVAGTGNGKWAQKAECYIEVIAAMLRPELSSPSFSRNIFTCTLKTDHGVTYVLESTSSFDAAGWTAVGLPIQGDGSVKVLTDTSVAGGYRYYRVRAWLR